MSRMDNKCQERTNKCQSQKDNKWKYIIIDGRKWQEMSVKGNKCQESIINDNKIIIDGKK